MADESIESKLNGSLEAIKAEFPDKGVCIIVVDAVGKFSCSSNIGAIHGAALLEHAAKHLKKECNC